MLKSKIDDICKMFFVYVFLSKKKNVKKKILCDKKYSKDNINFISHEESNNQRVAAILINGKWKMVKNNFVEILEKSKFVYFLNYHL